MKGYNMRNSRKLLLGVVAAVVVLLFSCSGPQASSHFAMPWDTVAGRFLGVKKVSGYLHQILQKQRPDMEDDGVYPRTAILSFISNQKQPIPSANRDTIRLTERNIYVLRYFMPAEAYVQIQNHMFNNTNFTESTRLEIINLVTEGAPKLVTVDSIETDDTRYVISQLESEEVLLFTVNAQDALERLTDFRSIPHTFQSKEISLGLLIKNKARIHELVPRKYFLDE
jgi:hypothetical protein